MKKQLTEKQRSVLEFLKQHIKEYGYPPTQKEVCDEFGLASATGAKRHLQALERKGYITRDSRARSITILEDEAEINKSVEQLQATSLPLLGKTAAGCPLYSEEHAEDHIPIPTSWLVPGKEHFLLTVQGSSMEPTISDGDLIVVCNEQNARNNDIIVAVIEDELTTKRFFKSNNRISLLSDNPDYPDIIITQEIRIAGTVIGLLRQF